MAWLCRLLPRSYHEGKLTPLRNGSGQPRPNQRTSPMTQRNSSTREDVADGVADSWLVIEGEWAVSDEGGANPFRARPEGTARTVVGDAG